MQVLAATIETQGWRKNDFSWTVDGELVIFGPFDCGRGDVDDGRGDVRRWRALTPVDGEPGQSPGYDFTPCPRWDAGRVGVRLRCGGRPRYVPPVGFGLGWRAASQSHRWTRYSLGAPGGIRTHTVAGLSDLPLPVGIRGLRSHSPRQYGTGQGQVPRET
jgi:hypothetical protein